MTTFISASALTVGFAVTLGFALVHYQVGDYRAAIWWGLAAWLCAGVGLAALAFNLFGNRRPKTETQVPTLIDPTYLTVEQFRARLSIKGAELTALLEPGTQPAVQFTFTNTGKLAAEKVTYACQALITADLPRWETSEFDKIAAAHGNAFPKRDEFYSTTIEPDTTKTVTIPFKTIAEYIDAVSKSRHSNLQIGITSPFGPDRRPMTQRVFFVGLADYNTMAKTYRLRFCYTPKTYPGLDLVECGQWNKTEELSRLTADGTSAERKERHVTANVTLLGVDLSTGHGILNPTTRMSLFFFNIGPTPARDLKIAYAVGPQRQILAAPAGAAIMLAADAGLKTPPLPTLAEVAGAESVRHILSGEIPLVVQARVTYKDDWGDQHAAQFVYIYNPKSRDFERTSEERE